jgi:predicted nuclease of predicted toxin-antitoxin system
MTFLIDENLPRKLTRALADRFPNCVHVSDVRLLQASDAAIWQFAKRNGLALLSKDDDLRQMAEDRGPPPKLVWLRFGNCSTADLSKALLEASDAIAAFLADDAAAVLSLP